MDVSKISPGKDVPFDINVVIEIPQGSSVKYEVDKDSGAIFVDRFLFTPMAYPTAYGFIPGTLAADGDPTDALVLTPANVVPGSVIRSRPIGVLKMEDESGQDEKIICVPHDKIHPQFSKVESIQDLPEITVKAIEHFFTRYKDLEPGKWVKVTGWGTKEEAADFIRSGVEAAKAK
ncbi:inorganic diphosphatase [Acetobacter indonesiensis]|jgi:inorganic pyrophosphatase|uniref:Inorganic pyrophosphatase n=1 Tax=Acetobacter indonesiensis TaxID=104101 RepID=A0A252ATJ0_9PROT|nr:inorganic diphosphatase [Acetobacter indonesiensis]MCG0995243.1 inorganic diphosphatase [Acetobacter indonesiensis]MCI1438149.1 inorganic diphosphatase [Acetobacter indonesiensis]MCI1546731.1 inorganic diphosphatase [Acetobacter indonesiensis]MCI1766083.1 inorganic diphosphatase [Acetobacter indonesiensis]MCP1231344.1 inorganic diphosphatase [Acetobacter indonesiensis]